MSIVVKVALTKFLKNRYPKMLSKRSSLLKRSLTFANFLIFLGVFHVINNKRFFKLFQKQATESCVLQMKFTLYDLI